MVPYYPLCLKSVLRRQIIVSPTEWECVLHCLGWHHLITSLRALPNVLCDWTDLGVTRINRDIFSLNAWSSKYLWPNISPSSARYSSTYLNTHMNKVSHTLKCLVEPGPYSSWTHQAIPTSSSCKRTFQSVFPLAVNAEEVWAIKLLLLLLGEVLGMFLASSKTLFSLVLKVIWKFWEHAVK